MSTRLAVRQRHTLVRRAGIVPSPGAVAVAAGRIMAVGPDDELRDAAAPGDRDRRSRRRPAAARDSRTLTCTRSWPASTCCVATCTRCESAEEVLAVIAAYVAAHPDLEWVVGARLVDGALRRRHADAPAARRRRRRPPGVLPQPRRPRRVGEHRGDRTRRPRRPDPRPGRRPHRARARRLPGRHAARGRRRPRRTGCCPRSAPTCSSRACCAAQEHLFSLGVTSWQDAAVGQMFGQRDILDVYLRAAESGDLVARVVGALWWDRNRSSDQIPELVERRAARPPRPVPSRRR